MKKICIIGLFLINFLVACTPAPQDIDLSTFVVRMERDPCFGPCPIYEVTIHGNGSVYYEGTAYVQGIGKKELLIPQEDVRALIDEIYKAKFFLLKNNYDAPITDLPTTTTTVTVNGKTKSVRNYYGAPQRLITLENKIDELSGISFQIEATRFPYDDVIFLQKTVCFGPCPVYEVAIYEDGHIEYEGFEYVNVTGKQQATLDPDAFYDLYYDLKDLGFFELNDSYLVEVEDAPTQTIFVQLGGRSKEIIYNIDPPKVLLEIEALIDNITGTNQWVGDQD